MCVFYVVYISLSSQPYGIFPSCSWHMFRLLTMPSLLARIESEYDTVSGCCLVLDAYI